MTRVAIVGAGRSGGQLAIGLLRHGYEVTLVSDRSPEQIRAGPVASGQCMFGPAAARERELGIDFWSDSCPGIDSLTFALAGAESDAWSAPLQAPAHSVDQRLKCAAWTERVAAEGGSLVLSSAGIAELEEYAQSHHLVIVATGKAELGRLFAPDPKRSPFDRPQRVMGLTYLSGMSPHPYGATLSCTWIPGVGECLTFPALTMSGPCDVVVFEGVPGGPMDCWDDVTTSEQHFRRTLELLEKFAAHEFTRCHAVTLTDTGGALRGSITPRVRRPVAVLPSGRAVLGMGDAVVLTDPITLQGANLAAHAASHYLDAITRKPTGGFDVGWMQRTFERFWRGSARWTVEWTNSVLGLSPAQRVAVLAEAAGNPDLRQAVVDGFHDPRQFFPLWSDFTSLPSVRVEKQASTSQFDHRELRRALGQYATGIAVVTALGPDGTPVGMTINSFGSASLNPPLVLWCADKNAPSSRAFANASHFAVHVLSAAQEHLAHQFSTPAEDKFAAVELADGIAGTPVLVDAIARFECRKVRTVDVGDHLMLLGEIEHYEARGGTPLIFHSGAIRSL